MDTPSINYVIASWSGPRRVGDARYAERRDIYVREHIKSLERLPHNLAQITVVVPHNPEEPRYYRETLETLPPRVRDARVAILERPNVGMSYGSFSDTYGKYGRDFEYYIFMEDDYQCVQPHFDQLLLNMMAESPSCGFLCGLVQYSHAAVYLGIVKSIACQKVWDKYQMLPYANASPGGDYRSNEQAGQVNQSRAFMEVGYGLLDVLPRYKTGFRNFNMSISWFGNQHNPPLFVPI